MLNALLIKHQRFLRFAVVGGVCTLVDYAIFFSLHHFGMGIILANIAAYSAGIIANFFFNRRWTFSDSQYRSARRLKVAFLWGYCGLALNTGLVWAFSQLGSVVIAKILTTAIMLFVNYTANRLIVFRAKH